jgi:hypothetical protein
MFQLIYSFLGSMRINSPLGDGIVAHWQCLLWIKADQASGEAASSLVNQVIKAEFLCACVECAAALDCPGAKCLDGDVHGETLHLGCDRKATVIKVVEDDVVQGAACADLTVVQYRAWPAEGTDVICADEAAAG